MSKNANDSTEKPLTGRAFGGSNAVTACLIGGLLLIVTGVALTVFLGGVTAYIFGVPLVVIGLLIPIAAQLVFGFKRD